MRTKSKVAVLWIMAMAFACSVSGFGQQTAPSTQPSQAPSTQEPSAQQGQPSEKDVDSEIEVVRADLRADKVRVIKETMNFTPEESSQFWPIYRRYEDEVKKLNDRRIDLIKSYADKYNSMTDADAKKLANDSFDLESRRVDLRKEYFRKFSDKLSPTTAARFFQLENRLDLLLDLQLAAGLPPLLQKPTAGGHASPNEE